MSTENGVCLKEMLKKGTQYLRCSQSFAQLSFVAEGQPLVAAVL